jgi:hypothetical protein
MRKGALWGCGFFIGRKANAETGEQQAWLETLKGLLR